MDSNATPFSVSEELAAFMKSKQTQNKHLQRLPPNTMIQRRPINHAPIASPYAGASVPKVVYVSQKTPLMAAVKRVQKLLHHIEKRAMQKVSLIDQDTKGAMIRLAEDSKAMEKSGQREVVLVKASGKAMVQALKVGEWFRNRETKMICQVETKTGSVSVVDDIVEVKNNNERGDATDPEMIGDDATFEGFEDSNPDTTKITTTESSTPAKTIIEIPAASDRTEVGKSTSSRKRKKRPIYDIDDLPEARIRWIKTVEVAISLKG